jgi:hypothetical protein
MCTIARAGGAGRHPARARRRVCEHLGPRTDSGCRPSDWPDALSAYGRSVVSMCNNEAVINVYKLGVEGGVGRCQGLVRCLVHCLMIKDWKEEVYSLTGKGYCSMSVGFGEDTIYEAYAKRAPVPQLASSSIFCIVTCMHRCSCPSIGSAVVY